MYTSQSLKTLKHGFFTRQGGVSQGVFESLNFTISKGDTIDHVHQNRGIALEKLGLTDKTLLTVNQVHGNQVIIAEEPWPFNEGQTPNADAILTQNPSLVLGIFTADCVPILLHDKASQTIGVIHAGWRGAREGIVSETIQKMYDLGAQPADIQAVIGPAIDQKNYEVSDDVFTAFITLSPSHMRFFKASEHKGKFLFNLKGLVAEQLKFNGLKWIEDMSMDTYTLEKDFFSCRRAFHQGEKSFGCMLSAISLSGT